MGRARAWIPDTRFGRWFQETRVWQRYVLDPAFESWARILAARAGELPLHGSSGTGGRWLDAGCGAGLSFSRILALLAPAELFGLEVDPRLADGARRAARACAGAVRVCEGDLAKLDFEDASFDGVVCHQTLHHVNDPRAALGELYRVLRPGGLLLLAESCRRFTRSLGVRLFFRHPGSAQHAPGEFVRLVRDAGFEVREDAIRLSTPFWSLPDFGLAERLTGRPPRDDEPTQIALVARRPHSAVQGALAPVGSAQARPEGPGSEA